MVPVIDAVDMNMTMVSPACTPAGSRTTWPVRLPWVFAEPTKETTPSTAFAVGRGDNPRIDSVMAKTATSAASGRR